MKTVTTRTRRSVRSLAMVCCFGLAAASALPARAAWLYYNTPGNPGWFAANAWGTAPGTYDTSWIAGSSAFLSGVITVTNTANTTVDNLTLSNTVSLGAATPNVYTLTMNGGTLTELSPTLGSFLNSGVSILGDFTFTGGGWLRLQNNARYVQYAGTATIQNGRLDYYYPSVQIGTNSHFVVNGGSLIFQRDGSRMGSLTLNSGTFLLGRSAVHMTTFTTTVSRLSGMGGAVTNQGTNGVHTFVVDQSDHTSYAGQIRGTSAVSRIEVRKAGTGDLTLSGSIALARPTIVSGGRLYINSGSGTARFADETAGTTAILVDGGTLGGTGTVTVTDDADVMLTATGKLAAGIEGAAGRTTYTLNGGELDLSAATASTNTGWLKFDLSNPTTPSVTYDQILLSGGALNIGADLDFNAFEFQAPPNLKDGSYVLFETGEAIIGALGNVAGTFPGGSIAGTLRIDGNNLVLDVVNPPQGTLIYLQ